MSDVNVVLLAIWQQEKERELAAKQHEIDLLTAICHSQRMQVPFQALLAFNEVNSTPHDSPHHHRREWARKWMRTDGWTEKPEDEFDCIFMAEDDIDAAHAENVELLTWREERREVERELAHTKADLKIVREGWAKACPPNKELFPSSMGISNPIHVE